ncbi:MAG: 6-carboxytetrahydropterin synthase QueD [Deltaproteobacteria bacterium]|nr:6-carboxytetrahydropterin synthase QueD [Deltaproteobacteria bacterium]
MAGVYEVVVQTCFSAAHALRGYQGDCARMHGHNWTVTVHVECERTDEVGIAVDFRTVKAKVQEAVSELDHQTLNELDAFSQKNPTSENVAEYLYRRVSGALNAEGVRVSRVSVFEAPGAGIIFREE